MRKITTGATWQLTEEGMYLEEESFYFVPENAEIAECKGSKKTESVSSYPKEFIPYITQVMDDAQNAYESGDLGKVAGLDPRQIEALNQGEAASKQQNLLAQQGRGALDKIRSDMGARDTTKSRDQAMWASAGGLNKLTGSAGASNNLGGSRQALSRMGIENDLGRSFYDIENNELNRQTQAAGTFQGAIGAQQGLETVGAQTLGQVGQVYQQQAQAEADKEQNALQSLSGMYQGIIPRQTNTTQTGGK